MHLTLVHQGQPVLGVVLLPEKHELWFGLVGAAAEELIGGAWRENPAGQRFAPQLSERREPAELVLVGALGLGSSLAVGSVGCKVATILRGETDLYLTLSPPRLQQQRRRTAGRLSDRQPWPGPCRTV